MGRLDDLAEISVARGCGFGLLAIATLMLGLSWDMILSAKVGGMLALTAALILALKARRAARVPYRRTELWLMLERGERPAAGIAQRVIGGVLRRWYLYFALQATALAAGLLALSLMLALLQVG
jgi:hypothetical protein